ncbi:MAG: hypothetical protein ACI9CF_001286 [Candidatus Omnitrophota bacterium]|jgi:hypothetical protein
MTEEREWDVPEWEVPEEEIPPALQNKWNADEARGIRASICSKCGQPFIEEELSCRYCGESIEVSSGLMGDTLHFFSKTPWGIITLIILILSIVAWIL